MMFGLFAGVLTAAWLQFLANLTERAAPLLTPEETARMERILDRCEADRAEKPRPRPIVTRNTAALGSDPAVVGRWVSFLEDHNAVLVVGRRDLAVAVSTPKPERVH